MDQIEFHPIALYLGAVALITIRAFLKKEDGKNMWLRDIMIALVIGIGTLFIPMRSGGMAVLLAIAFLVGTIALSALFVNTFGQSGSSFAGKLLFMFSLVLLALFIAGAPLVLLGWMQQ